MDNEKIWRAVLAEIEVGVSKAVFKTFFAQSFLISLEKNLAKIAFPSAIIAQMVESRYYSLLKRGLDKQTGQNCSLLFEIKKLGQKEESPGPLFSPPKIKISSLLRSYHLQADFTFENFAVSSSNQMAHAAARAVARRPGSAYNPLFLYGGVGVGKTHLMQAIGHSLLVKNPKTRLIYCMGEDFTNEIIDAIRNKSTKSFREKYRRAEILLIDDVQFIAGKNSIQEEFFHTFNSVYREGGQVVLTSDRPPSEIKNLEDRLRSRFEGGLIVDISPADFELRTAILLIKARQRGFDFPIELAKIVATNIKDVRKSIGILTRIQSEVESGQKTLGSELINKIISRFVKIQNDRPKPSAEQTIEAVSAYFKIKSSLLCGGRRDKTIVVPRQILMYLLRDELGLPLMKVGEILGGRDHTTIMHGVNKINRELSANPRLREDVLGIKRELWGKVS